MSESAIKNGRAVFAFVVIAAGLWLWSIPVEIRHPAKTTVVERKPGECKCPGGYMCISCQTQPKDKICRCEPTKADYDRAAAAFKAVQQAFSTVVNINPDF
jgi:hypothetical protein